MRPRIRTLKPETWSDERVGDLSHGARLLFVGLITMADDDGRLRELVTAINGHVFPYDEISRARLSRWLGEVERTGMIVRYEAAGKRYIAFRHWSRHQRVDRPSTSDLPAPDSALIRRNGDEQFDESIDESGADDSIPPRRRASGPFPSDPVVGGNDQLQAHVDRELFDYWRERCSHPDAKPTKDRMAKIRARRGEGYTDQQIRQAIDGAARAAHVSDAGRRFDDIELVCRSGSKLESFIARASGPASSPTGYAQRPSPTDLLRRLDASEAAAS